MLAQPAKRYGRGSLTPLLQIGVAVLLGLLIVTLPPLYGALLVGGVLICVATLVEPLVSLALALFLGVLHAYIHTWVPQIPNRIAQVFLLLALAAWLARKLVQREINLPRVFGNRMPRPITDARFDGICLALLIFTMAGLISFWDVDSNWAWVYGLPELTKWIQILLLYVFLRDDLTPRRLTGLLAILMGIGTFEAGVGIWQFALRGDTVDPLAALAGRFYGWQPSTLKHFWVKWIEPFAIMDGRFYRAYGTFEQPNPYAGYLGMMLALALGCAWGVLSGWWQRRQDPQHKRFPIQVLIYLLPAALMAPALVMSWSRGGWLGFAAALLAMAVALPRKPHWKLLLVAVLVIGGIGVYASGLMPASIIERLTDFAPYVQFNDVRGISVSDAGYSVVERLAHWQAAVDMFRYNIWNGVGLSCYHLAYPEFALINWPYALGHAHNIYLNMAAETGVIGLVAYLLLWGVIGWQTWRAVSQARGMLRGVAIGLLGAWVHLSVHHLLDNLYVNNVHLIVGVMLGVLAYCIQNVQGKNRSLSHCHFE